MRVSNMSASLKPLTVDEFLAWERTQPLRYEFDGIQPGAAGSLRVSRRGWFWRLGRVSARPAKSTGPN